MMELTVEDCAHVEDEVTRTYQETLESCEIKACAYALVYVAVSIRWMSSYTVTSNAHHIAPTIVHKNIIRKTDYDSRTPVTRISLVRPIGCSN